MLLFLLVVYDVDVFKLLGVNSIWIKHKNRANIKCEKLNGFIINQSMSFQKTVSEIHVQFVHKYPLPPTSQKLNIITKCNIVLKQTNTIPIQTRDHLHSVGNQSWHTLMKAKEPINFSIYLHLKIHGVYWENIAYHSRPNSINFWNHSQEYATLWKQ